jgi:hypothetical protein
MHTTSSLAHTVHVRPLPRWAGEDRGPAGFQPSGPVLLAPVPSSSGASMVTAGSEAAGDEAPHRAVWEPYQLGSAVTARCRWSSGVVVAWLAGQRSSAVAGDGETRRAEVLVRRRGQW